MPEQSSQKTSRVVCLPLFANQDRLAASGDETLGETYEMASDNVSKTVGLRFIDSLTVSLISHTPTGAQYPGPISRQTIHAPDLPMASICSSTARRAA